MNESSLFTIPSPIQQLAEELLKEAGRRLKTLTPETVQDALQ